MLNALLGPSLRSVEPVKINIDKAWLGLGSLYVAALASKYFNEQTYSQKALEFFDLGEKALSGIELFNEMQNIVASSKWVKEARVSSNSSDFFVKRAQAYRQILCSSAGVVCNAVSVGFFLKRLRVIQLSSDSQRQLKKIHSVFSLFQQAISFFQESRQAYLCNSLSRNSSQWIRKELNEKSRLCLFNIAEIFAKVFLSTLERMPRKLDGAILALSSCILTLKIFSHFCNDQSLHRGKWQFSENKFIYAN